MIRLTTAHYYTPAGRDIQKPYEKGAADAYRDDISERFNHGELMHADSTHYDEKLRTSTLLHGRKIYGGGGISPDCFVPLDTMPLSRYYRELTAKGLIIKYSVNYVDSHRKEIKKLYKDDNKFVSGFEVSPVMLDEIKAMADKAGIKFDQKEYDRCVPLLKTVVKGLIGRDIYENQTYDKVYNSHNDIFREALRVIESEDYDKLLSGK